MAENFTQPLPEQIRREDQILEQLRCGLQAKEIAAKLGLTVGTVRAYLKMLYSKHHVHSGLELVAKLRTRDRCGDCLYKLLDAITVLLSAESEASICACLAAGLRSATNAHAVTFWTVAIHADQEFTPMPLGPHCDNKPSTAFLKRLVEHGWAEERTSRVPDQISPIREMAVVLVRLRSYRQFVHIAAGRGLSFNEHDFGVIRVLSELASRQIQAAALRGVS